MCLDVKSFSWKVFFNYFTRCSFKSFNLNFATSVGPVQCFMQRLFHFSFGTTQHGPQAPASPSLFGPPRFSWCRPGGGRFPVLPGLWTPHILGLLRQLCGPRRAGQSHEHCHIKWTVPTGEDIPSDEGEKTSIKNIIPITTIIGWNECVLLNFTETLKTLLVD